MDRKTLPNRIKSYLVVYIKTTAGVFRLLMILMLMVVSACTENKTINQSPPVTSQAGPDTRTDTDWGGGGTGDGGGGQGVRCGSKLMVRDIYEAKNNYGRDLPDSKFGPAGTATLDDAIADFLAERVVNFYRIAAYEEPAAYSEHWKKFSREMVFVPDNAHLMPSQDANSALALPAGCKLEQIAYWDETAGLNSYGVLHVDKTKWMELDQFNKGALLAHEYFFWNARRGGFKNSDMVRYKLGQLMSTEGLSSPFTGWVPSRDPKYSKWLPEERRGFKFCRGYYHESSNGVIFVQYQNDQGDQRIVLTSAALGDHTMPLLRGISTTLFKKWDRPNAQLYAVLDDALTTKVEGERISNESLKEAGLNIRNGGAPLLSLPVPSQDKVGRFSIINPYEGNTLSERPLKSQDDLSRAVNTYIQDLLQTKQNKTVVTDDVLSELIAALHRDVQIAMQSPQTSSEFSNWTAQLKKIENSGVQLAEADQQLLDKKIPGLLLNIKMGSYTRKSVESIIGERGLDRNPRSGASARITFGSESQDFTLMCSGWSETVRMMQEGELMSPLEN